jgi:hypothetical protein
MIQHMTTLLVSLSDGFQTGCRLWEVSGRNRRTVGWSSREESPTKGSFWENDEVAVKCTEEVIRGKGAILEAVDGRVNSLISR